MPATMKKHRDGETIRREANLPPRAGSLDLNLFTTPEAAQALGTGEATLERWRTEGVGPPFCKIGHRVAYRRKDLEAWVEANVRNST
jgi:predicted DNA-binding transcriptional regulator AlpA